MSERREGIEAVERLDSESALKDALYSLFIACNADEDTLTYALRSLVARCEAQGDGWQADPAAASRPRQGWDVTWLLALLSHEYPDWPLIANRAAAWLRSITEDAQ